MPSHPEFTIFYAWQSDTPPSHNRYLIEEALNQACQQLREDAAIPYTVTSTSDTAGVPGLCDIPAAILEKIQSADAVLLDLTYVAKTTSDTPKHCPNPNVLFELGYAFHAVGSERLICVMNAIHGPATGILFDIGHRRHPIQYSSPLNGKTRAQVVDTLAKSLAAALGPTVQLGPRSISVDSEKEFELLINSVRRQWQTQKPARKGPIVFFSFHPTRYRERRWPTADDLSEFLITRYVPNFDGRNFYPPHSVGTNRTYWGLSNARYGTPDWALTYSGLFWAATDIASHYPFKTPEGSPLLGSTGPEPKIAEDTWFNLNQSRLSIANAYRFAASIAESFHPKEEVIWSAIAEQIDGSTMVIEDDPFFSASGPCASPIATRSGVASAESFANNWPSHCLDFVDEFIGMYQIEGDYIARSTHEARITAMIQRVQRSEQRSRR